MLIDARERFAARVAQWMYDDKEMSVEETELRLSQWSDDFNVMVSQALRKIVKQGR